ESEIKSAYKKLAKQWHPDVNKSPSATEKFKELSEAYSVLSDPQKRQTYDQFGSDAANQGFSGFGGQGFPGGGGAGFDFSDFFSSQGGASGFGNMEDLLRSAFGAEFSSEQSARRRGTTPSNLRVDLELPFEEAAFGTNKKIEINHTIECSTCSGSGSSTGKREKCSHCKGRGMETQTRRTPFGMFQTTTMCSRCGGAGEVVSDPCKTCHGKGSVKKTSTIEVKIPAGVDTGNHLRIPKQGNYSEGKNGDVFVVLHVQPHPVFQREGADLYMEQAISFADAALGAEVDVPILDEKNKTASLKIPAGTKPGTVFRLTDRGIKFLHESAHGDQFIKVTINVPEKLSSDERELLEQLRAVQNGTPKHSSEGKESKKSKKKGFFGL
ncbi:MAG: molecular chaperone DnaJ, partial [archaeon]